MKEDKASRNGVISTVLTVLVLSVLIIIGPTSLVAIAFLTPDIEVE